MRGEVRTWHDDKYGWEATGVWNGNALWSVKIYDRDGVMHDDGNAFENQMEFRDWIEYRRDSSKYREARLEALGHE